MNKGMVALALLLLFFSAGCTGFAFGAPKKFWAWGWESLTGVAFIIVVLALALGYMAATVVGDEKVKAWVKKELGQVFYSAIILIVAVSLVGVLDWWLRELSIGTLLAEPSWQNYVSTVVCCKDGGICLGPIRKRPCHIELASDFLQLLYETARMNSIASLINYWTYAFVSNISTGISTRAFGIQTGLNIMPFAGLSAAADYFSQIFDLAVKTMMLARAQQVLLDFLNYPVFGIFLSMGLVMRIFYFTRKMGGLLVALALGFYVVYPMFYVVSYAVLWGFLGSWTPFGVSYDSTTYVAPFTEGGPVEFTPSKDAKNVFDPSSRVNLDICDSVNTGSTAAIRAQAATDRADAESVRSNFRSSWDMIEGTGWYTQFGDLISAGAGTAFSKDGPVGSLATLMVYTLVVPFLGLMTTLASVKVLSPMIGGDVEISLLSRLI